MCILLLGWAELCILATWWWDVHGVILLLRQLQWGSGHEAQHVAGVFPPPPTNHVPGRAIGAPILPPPNPTGAPLTKWQEMQQVQRGIIPLTCPSPYGSAHWRDAHGIALLLDQLQLCISL